MGADLVMQDSHDATLTVLNRQADVDLSFAALGIMRDACRRYFVFAEVENHLVCHLQVLKIVHEVLLGLFLS